MRSLRSPRRTAGEPRSAGRRFRTVRNIAILTTGRRWGCGSTGGTRRLEQRSETRRKEEQEVCEACPGRREARANRSSHAECPGADRRLSCGDRAPSRPEVETSHPPDLVQLFGFWQWPREASWRPRGARPVRPRRPLRPSFPTPGNSPAMARARSRSTSRGGAIASSGQTASSCPLSCTGRGVKRRHTLCSAERVRDGAIPTSQLSAERGAGQGLVSGDRRKRNERT